MTSKKKHHWTYKEFTIIQFIPTNEYSGVWAMDCDGGGYQLQAWPIAGLAVADVEEVTQECSSDGHPHKCDYRQHHHIIDTETSRRIIAINLTDGTFEPCEEASNFGGIIRTGDPLYADDGEPAYGATHFLEGNYLEKLIPPPATSAERTEPPSPA